ncbi:hypothetical protein D3C75_957730 [compost metagenome]
MREARTQFLADAGRCQRNIVIGKFPFAVGSHFATVVIVQTYDRFPFPGWPQQGVFIYPVGFSQSNPKGRAESFGTGIIKRTAACKRRNGPVRKITER